VRQFNYGQAIGVMNYWNYFNAAPGVEPAGMLILDDVHLLEGPLRDLFTVCIRRADNPYEDVLQLIVARCPYYSLAEDLLNGVDSIHPPEMLVFPDSADLSDDVRGLLDAQLVDGSDAWWGWQRVRERLEVCCWLVSARGVTFTPYIPPSQTLRHFAEPARRLYLSATIGSVDDLRRRLGTPPLEKPSAVVQPRQGERLVVIRDVPDSPMATDLVEELRPFLERHRKALWLCARRDTAEALNFALTLSGLPGQVRVLGADNGADEPFAREDAGHLITAGRYDGMDFPGDSCRVEILRRCQWRRAISRSSCRRTFVMRRSLRPASVSASRRRLGAATAERTTARSTSSTTRSSSAGSPSSVCWTRCRRTSAATSSPASSAPIAALRPALPTPIASWTAKASAYAAASSARNRQRSGDSRP
jgi:hypothetical protein